MMWSSRIPQAHPPIRFASCSLPLGQILQWAWMQALEHYLGSQSCLDYIDFGTIASASDRNNGLSSVDYDTTDSGAGAKFQRSSLEL
jgi:hypothetical protein